MQFEFSPQSSPFSARPGRPGQSRKPVELEPTGSPVLVEFADEELSSAVLCVVAPLELDPVVDDDSIDVAVVVVTAVSVPEREDESSSTVVLELPDPVSATPTAGLQPRPKGSSDSSPRRNEDVMRPS